MKIAFVAMSGIRVVDEELLRVGLTLPGFVERSKTIASLPSLGLLTLAGMTDARHEKTYHEVEGIRSLDVLPGPYDLVAISSLSSQVLEAYEIAARFRAAGSKVVLGGLHVTAMPDEAKQHADAIVVGEGESAWPDILRDAEAGTLRNVYDVREKQFDLAFAPMPAFELLDMDKYNRITIQTSRGCPFKCSFCASSILLTSKYKQKPVDKVLAEVDRVRALNPRPFFELADDNSFVNRKYWRQLLPELAKRRIRWFTESDISFAEDEELLDLARDAGCVEVLIGLESPSAEGMDGLERRSNWKAKRVAQYEDAVRTIQSHGIRVNGCFIVGLDGQTPAVFDAIYDFAERTSLFDVQITLPTPFPGTPYYDELKAAGRLTHDGAWNRNTLFDLSFVPSTMTKDEVVKGFRALGERLYSDAFTKQRREGFNERYLRPNVQKRRAKLHVVG